MWNNVNSLSREHQMLEMYQKHQNVMRNIKTKRGCVYSDDSEPIRPTFLQGETRSRKLQVQREMEVETENRCLFNRMQDITNKPGVLNPILLKKQKHIKGSLNLDQRVQTMKTIMNQNQSLENRLANSRKNIDNVRLEKEYKQNSSYIQNISKHSRRIVNCFLDIDKMQKYASASSLNKAIRSQHKLSRMDKEESNKQNELKSQQNEEQQKEEQKDAFFITDQ